MTIWIIPICLLGVFAALYPQDFTNFCQMVDLSVKILWIEIRRYYLMAILWVRIKYDVWQMRRSMSKLGQDRLTNKMQKRYPKIFELIPDDKE